MGLQEKRATKQFVETKFDPLKASINEIAGFDIEFDVDWDKLAADDHGHLYEEAWTSVYFQPVINAFTSICEDEFGREALKEGLKKIVIQNTNDNYSAGSWANFEGGVLTLDHGPVVNIHHVDDRTKSLQTLIEKAL